MFAKATSHHTSECRHFVDNGNVWCPVKKSDTDIENCLGCPALKRVGEIDNLMYVQCETISSDQFEIGMNNTVV